MKLFLFAIIAIVASCFITTASAQTNDTLPEYCAFGNYSCQPGQPCACRNNGTCSVVNSVVCSCTPGAWSNLQCQTPLCTRRNNCNSGRCVAPDTCDCTGTGFNGTSCDIPVCDPPCRNGICGGPNSCNCAGTGYAGSLCEVPLCDEIGGCLRGFCELPNVCNCSNTGWSGNNCEIPVCVNPCVNGQCVGPNSCQCPSNFGGTYCEVALCNPPCQVSYLCNPFDLGEPWILSVWHFRKSKFLQLFFLNSSNMTDDHLGSTAIGWTGSFCNQALCNIPCQNGGRCTGPNQCDCRGTGYAGTQCQTEINECNGTPRPCSSVSVCTNTPGNFTCSPCPSGYNGTGYGTNGCTDINECLLGRCDPLTNCTNTIGNFSCTACPPGYNGTALTGCVDFNECAHGACSPNSNCTNLPGSFNCSACFPGYRGRGYTALGGCTDINECDPANRVCDPIVTCQNLDGSFTCGNCPEGYLGTALTGCVPVCNPPCQNGGTCIRPNVCSCTGTGYSPPLCANDLDECLDPLSCDILTNCTNEVGGYMCSPCPSGYSGNGKTGCIPICDPQCQNGGICVKPDECACDKNWGGNTCEEYVEDTSGSSILKSLGFWGLALFAFCFFNA